MSTYKSSSSKIESTNLYDEQIKKLSVQFTNIYIDTSFGKTQKQY